MALPGEIGWIGKNCPDHRQVPLDAKIMRSNAGYYVGTICQACQMSDPSPFSRESHYYDDRDDLVTDILHGTVRWRDSEFHPAPLELIYLTKEE